MRLMLAIALVAIAVVAVMMILRPSGPRITTIEHRRDDVDETDDRRDRD